MKSIYLIIPFMLFTTIQLFAQTWDWTKLQPNGNQSSSPHSLGTDAQGFVYVLGDYNDSLFLNNTFITKGNGSYIAKYDSTGKMYWYKLISLEGGGNIGAASVFNAIASEFTVNQTGIYITGTVNGYNYQYPFHYSIGSSTYTVDTAGDYLYNQVGLQFFVCKMDFNGDVVWNKTSLHAGVAGHLPSDMEITSDKNNNIIVAGGKNPVRLLDPPNYPVTNTFFLGGSAITDNTGQPYSDQFFYIKISPAGIIQWTNFANDISSLPNLTNNSLACDNSNNIYVHVNVGNDCQFGTNTFITTHGDHALSVLAKLTSTGTWSFVKELSTLNEVAHSYMGKPKLLTIDNSNNLYAVVSLYLYGLTPYLVGNPVAIGTTSPTMYVVKFNSNGNVFWTKNFGENAAPSSSLANLATAIAYNNGKLQLTGNLNSWWLSTSSYYKFGALSVYNPQPSYGGSYDYFIAEADTALNFNWVQTFRTNSQATGFAITKFNDNIYTAGNTVGSIISLGNLNDTLGYPGYPYILNQFLGKLKDRYIRVGAISAKQVMPGCVITVPFTSTGFALSGTNRFIAELSNSLGDFTTPTTIGSVKSTGTGSIRATIPTSLAVGSSGYKIRIRSTDTLLTGFNYFAYADTGYTLSVACPATASGLSSTNITGTTATLNWAAVGCAAGYKVQYRVKGTTAWTTLQVPALALSAALTGLTVNTIYQWRIATKCNNNSTVSFSPYSPIQQFTTTAVFALSGETTSAVTNSNSIRLAIQPNPAKSNAVMVISGAVKNSTVTITDFVGKPVWKKDGVNAGQVVLPVQNLAAGIYLVKLVNGNETRMVKLVRE
ncbi:MAG: T9SS type A sorting domain-containing protein [Panacibacter sp.]